MSHGPPDLPIHLIPPLGGLLSTRGGHGKGLQPCLTIREDLTERAPNGPTGCTEPTQGAHITIQLCSDEYRSPRDHPQHPRSLPFRTVRTVMARKARTTLPRAARAANGSASIYAIN